MKNLLALFFILIFTTNGISQDLVFKNSGAIPNDLLSKSTTKYQNDLKELKKVKVEGAKSSYKKFYLENNFKIDHLMKSGDVIFNEDYSEYFSKIVSQFNLTTKKKYNFFIIKSSAVNAFATDRGNIFICAGLLAKLENEAQLAYVLAHEMSHVEHAHTLSMYIESVTIDKQQPYSFSNEHALNKMLKKSNFSKQQELEADNDGFIAFSNSKYSPYEIEKVFSILELAHTPFAEVSCSATNFETPYLKFPQKYTLDTLIPVKAIKDTSISTHPSIDERKENSKTKLLNNTNTALFIVSESQFKNLKQIAQSELSAIELEDFNFIQGLYNAYAFSKLYPELSKKKEKEILQSLYYLSILKNNSSTKELDRLFSDLKKEQSHQGEISQLIHFFEAITQKEINILVLDYAWKLKKSNPKDSFIQEIYTETIKQLIDNSYSNIEELKVATTNLEMDLEDSNRVDYALTDALKDSAFVNDFTSLSKMKIVKEQSKKDKIINRTFQTKNAVIISPITLKQSFRGNYDYLKTEAYEEKVLDLIKQSLIRTNFDGKLITIPTMDSSKIQDFDDYNLLKKWYIHEVSYNIPNPYQEKALKILEKHNTSSVILPVVVNYIAPNNNLAFSLFYLLSNIGTPLAINSFINGYRKVSITMVVADVKTKETYILKEIQARHKGDSLLKAHFYDAFSLLKTNH